MRFSVSLQRCRDYSSDLLDSALRRLLEPMGGMRAFVSPGQKVLLKPNLILPRPRESAVTTDPALVVAVARLVRESGGIPTVGDSPAFGSIHAVAETSGHLQAAREINLPIIDLGGKGKRMPTGEDCPWRSVVLNRSALESDVVINLPKIKVHCQMGVSLGTKNLFGAVPGKRKALYHFLTHDDRLRFAKLLVAVARIVRPQLTIADGVIALERDGPTSGDARHLGILAASNHPIAIDHVLMDILGIGPEENAIIAAAREMGYGPSSLEEIALLGEEIAGFRVPDFAGIEALRPIGFSLGRVIRSILRQASYIARGARRD